MKINSGVSNNGKQSSTKQRSTKQRSTSEEKANLQNANSEKMNTKQKTVTQSAAFPKNMVQRTKSQEKTLQGTVPQGDAIQRKAIQRKAIQETVLQGDAIQENTPQENATPDSVQSRVAVNRALILQKIELKHKLEKKYSGLQHSDDKKKLEIIEEIRDIIDDNGFDENFLREHSDCSESSIRRILSAWMCKSMSNWTTIFNMTTCLSVNCVFAEHLLALLVSVVNFLLNGAGEVHCHILSSSKAVIEIDFSKNKSLYKKNKDDNKEEKDSKNGTKKQDNETDSKI